MSLQRILSRKQDHWKVLFRENVYRPRDMALMARELCALANTDGAGNRYIFFNAMRDMNGDLQFTAAQKGAVNQLETLVEKAGHFLEPKFKLRAVYGDINGKLGIGIELVECTDSPYMIKANLPEEFYPGSCWVKDDDVVRIATRVDFDRMYSSAKPANKEPSTPAILVGINDDVSASIARIVLPDISGPPSAMAATRIKQTLASKEATASEEDDKSIIARLSHARLYGADVPYDERGINTLIQGFNSVVADHLAEDNHFHFETNAVKLNISIRNMFSEPLENVSFILTFPNIEQCRVADRLYTSPLSSMSPKESELQGYPTVRYFEDTIRVSQKVAAIQPQEILKVFEQELRLSCQPELLNRKLAVHYIVQSPVLPHAISGRLRLAFTGST